jgi:hypothetical protein
MTDSSLDIIWSETFRRLPVATGTYERWGIQVFQGASGVKAASIVYRPGENDETTVAEAYWSLGKFSYWKIAPLAPYAIGARLKGALGDMCR